MIFANKVEKPDPDRFHRAKRFCHRDFQSLHESDAQGNLDEASLDLLYLIPIFHAYSRECLGAVYNGRAIFRSANLRWWQASPSGRLTFASPMALTRLWFR